MRTFEFRRRLGCLLASAAVAATRPVSEVLVAPLPRSRAGGFDFDGRESLLVIRWRESVTMWIFLWSVVVVVVLVVADEKGGSAPGSSSSESSVVHLSGSRPSCLSVSVILLVTVGASAAVVAGPCVAIAKVNVGKNKSRRIEKRHQN